MEPRDDSWVTQIFSVSDVSDVSVDSWIVVTEARSISHHRMFFSCLGLRVG